MGDTLFIGKNNKTSKATIISIKQNDKPIQSATNGEFGLELDIPIKKNSKIWKEIK